MKPSVAIPLKGQQPLLLAAAAAVFCLGFAIQAFTPLRLNTDAQRLLAMAVSAFEGNGYLVQGERDQFPVGYPLMVRIMLDWGIASSAAFVIANLVFLGAGLTGFYLTCRHAGLAHAGLGAVLLTLSSWVLIKHFTIPLTEPFYVCVSFLSLFFAARFYREPGMGRWLSMFVATALAFLAYQTRTIGLVLFPVLCVTVFIHPSHASLLESLARGWKKLILIPLATLALVAVSLTLLSGTPWFESQFLRPESYFQSMLSRFGNQSLPGYLFMNAGYRALEAGELALNLPASRVGGLIPLFYIAGGLFWLMLILGASRMVKGGVQGLLVLYFTLYAAVFFLWPYYDARFWVPVLPVMALIGWQFAVRFRKGLVMARLFLAVYLLLGTIALAYSTRLTFSGDRFSEHYGDGTLKMSYRFAQQNGLPVDTSATDPLAVELIGRFDPAGREASGQLVQP